MSDSKSPIQSLVIAFFIALFAIVLVRILAPFRFGLLAFFGLAIIGLAIYSLVIYLKKRRFNKSIEGNLSGRIEKAEAEVIRLKQEISQITEEVWDLKTQLKNPQLNSKTWSETERLIYEFEEEIKLRNTKIDFFKTAVVKLKYLLNNYQQTKSLEAKQAQLKQLRANQYDELADLERLKANLEYDQRQLENIETLTLKMLKSSTLGAAVDLQRELIEMTEDLEGN